MQFFRVENYQNQNYEPNKCQKIALFKDKNWFYVIYKLQIHIFFILTLLCQTCFTSMISLIEAEASQAISKD